MAAKKSDPMLTAHSAAVARYFHPARQGMARNVTGASIGYKNAQPSLGLSLRYLVKRKIRDQQAIAPDCLLCDPSGQNVTIDVEETGELCGFSQAAPGASLGLKTNAPNVTPMALSTLSGVVVRGKRKFLLSVNHGLAFNGRVPLGTQIYRRPWREFVTGEEPSLASLSSFVRLDRNGDNTVDCALAEIEDSGSVWIGDAVAPADAALFDKVYKETDRGRAQGRVTGTNTSVEIDFSFGTFRFADVLVIEGLDGRFATPGDSGGLVFHAGTRQPVAMIVGGSSTHVIACKLTSVLAALGGGRLHLGRR